MTLFTDLLRRFYRGLILMDSDCSLNDCVSHLLPENKARGFPQVLTAFFFALAWISQFIAINAHAQNRLRCFELVGKGLCGDANFHHYACGYAADTAPQGSYGACPDRSGVDFIVDGANLTPGLSSAYRAGSVSIQSHPANYSIPSHPGDWVFGSCRCQTAECPPSPLDQTSPQTRWSNGECYPCPEGTMLAPGGQAPADCRPVCEPGDAACDNCLAGGGGVACKCDQMPTLEAKQACFCANGIGGEACNNPGGGNPGGDNPGGGNPGGGNPGGGNPGGGNCPGRNCLPPPPPPCIGPFCLPPANAGEPPPPAPDNECQAGEQCKKCEGDYPFQWLDGGCHECPESNPNCKSCLEPTPHRWNSDGMCHDCPESDKECKGCTDSAKPYKWQADNKCHECPEGIHHCKCDSTTGSASPVTFVDLCSDGAASIEFKGKKTTIRNTRVGSRNFLSGDEPFLNFKWSPKSDGNGRIEKLLDSPLVVRRLYAGKILEYLFEPTDRPFPAKCSHNTSKGTLSFTMNKIPTTITTYDCKEALREDPSITDLQELQTRCILHLGRTRQRPKTDTPQLQVTFNLGTPERTEINGRRAQATLITSADVRVSSIKSSVSGEPIKDGFGFPVPAGQTHRKISSDNGEDSFTSTIVEILKPYQVRASVLSAFGDHSNYPNLATSLARPSGLNQLRATTDIIKHQDSYLAYGPEYPTWAPEIRNRYLAKATTSYEKDYINTLSYLADRCPGVTNADMVRAALKVTGGRRDLAALLTYNASRNLASFLRPMEEPPAPPPASLAGFYSRSNVEKIWRKMERLEDVLIQVLGDSFGPWYHFHGAIFAGALGFGRAVDFEIIKHDWKTRAANRLQNEAGKSGAFVGGRL